MWGEEEKEGEKVKREVGGAKEYSRKRRRRGGEGEEMQDAHESQIFSLQCLSRLLLYRAGGSLINGRRGGGREEGLGRLLPLPAPHALLGPLPHPPLQR